MQEDTHTFKEPINLLVIESYTASGRQEFISRGAPTASELYRDMFASMAPNANIDIIMPADTGAAIPTGAQLKSYDGAAMTGSSLSVLDSDNPAVQVQAELLRDLFEQGVPSYGSCWAMQLGAAVAGGVVAQNPKGREMAFARKVALTEEGRRHPLHEGKPAVFDAFASHDDIVAEPPPGAKVLSGNSFSPMQSMEIAYRDGVMWAVQYHPEYDMRQMANLVRCRERKLIDLGFFRDADGVLDYARKLELAHESPQRKDITWALGIDSDILDDSVRQLEARNWLRHQVLPRASR